MLSLHTKDKILKIVHNIFKFTQCKQKKLKILQIQQYTRSFKTKLTNYKHCSFFFALTSTQTCNKRSRN